MHIYEYLLAGLIIIVMLAASAFMMTTISTPGSNALEKDLLKITAEKIMTQMLLDSGYPYDWGNTSAVPQVFGLAKYGQTSREAYELDPDKVLRLNKTVAGDLFIPATGDNGAVSLLNLANSQGAPLYGFTLEVNEVLHISEPQQIGSDDTYSIGVTSEYELPAIGAKVSASLYYINNTTTPPKIGRVAIPPPYPVTGYDGSCTLTFGTLDSTAKILAVTVDYYGAHVAKLYNLTAGPTATLFQKGLKNLSEQYNIPSDADSREIILIHHDEGYEINDFAVHNTGIPTNFTLSDPPESSAVAVIAISGPPKDTLLLARRDFSQFRYQTIDFQDPNVRSASFAYSIERTVLIGGSAYTATLYLWRMSI